MITDTVNDNDGIMAERLNMLKASRAGLKARVTKVYNEIERHYGEKNLEQATNMLGELDAALIEFKAAHVKYFACTGKEGDPLKDPYYMEVVGKVDGLFSTIEQANEAEAEMTSGPPVDDKNSNKGFNDHQDDIHPEDSVSKVSCSTVTSSRVRAAAKTAAIKAKLKALETLQKLKADELAASQKRIAAEMLSELAAAEAEEKVFTDHCSNVGSNNSQQRPISNTPDITPSSKDVDSNKAQQELDPNAKAWAPPTKSTIGVQCSDVTKFSGEESILTFLQQSQQQQQQLVNSIQLPRAELLTFDGDPLRYWSFINSFKTNVDCTTASEASKLTRLLQYCCGKARRAIECCQMMDPVKGYNKALEILSERFGDSYLISETWINKIVDGPSLQTDDREGLQNLADELQNCVECLKAMNQVREIDSQKNMATIVRRLPRHLQARWQREVQRIKGTEKRPPTIEHLVKMTTSAAAEVNDPVYGDLMVHYNGKKGGSTKGKSANFSVNMGKPEGSKYPDKTCIVCNGKHHLFGCNQFKGLSVLKRREIASSNKLCFNCLNPSHMSKDCNLDRVCSVPGCGKKHTKFLHMPNSFTVSAPQQEEQAIAPVPDGNIEGSVGHASHLKAARISLPVIPVRVRAVGTGKWFETSALLDNGSTTTFCAEHLRQRLELTGEQETMSLTTLTGVRERLDTSVVSLELASPSGHTSLPLGEVYTVRHLPIKKDNVATRNDIVKFDHLCHLDIQFGNAENVGLLIGLDNSDVLRPLEVSEGENGLPYAVRTILGWTVNGPLGKAVRGQHSGTSHFIRADMELNRQVERFWSLEATGEDADEISMSVNDKHVVEVWNSSLNRVNEHYEFVIPFKERPLQLPNNKELAEKRLNSLGRRLLRNKDLNLKYKAGMDDLIAKGYAERLMSPSEDKVGEWYLPHHPVIHPHKPGKVRIVFDCASKYRGMSLNDNVHQGPDLTNKLVGVLLRFRVGPIALKADIEAMFHQVQVAPIDRDALRFLWWKDGNIGQPLEGYRMTVHLFGGIWSPSCANYALRRTAKDHDNDFDQETIQTVLKNFYVDDCLKSVTGTESAIRLASQLCELLSKGGFRLTKWVSNSREVLKSLPDTERAKEVQNLDLDNESLPVDRALGVNWNVDTDSFMFQIHILDKPLTRRGVLSMLSSVYDPLGFLCPYTLRAKMVFQDLCRRQLGWDEPLPSSDKERWCDWAHELPTLEAFKVERCFVPSDFGKVVSRQFHHFSDASEKALGTVTYIRLVNENGLIHVSFLIAKSRLAPLKTTTIPRLELCAAALAVKVDGMLRQEFDFSVESSQFWSDSTITLGYINNVERRFKTFVANRVSAIHKGSDASQWRHIDGKLNPADEASRGLYAADLLSNQRWLKGPSFLWTPKDEWPNNKASVDGIDEGDPEVKRQVQVYVTDTETAMTPTETLVSHYSSWTRLKRAVALFEKFGIYTYQRFCTGEARNETRWDNTNLFNSAFDVADLESAENGILKFVQSNTFMADIAALSSQGDKPLPKSSSIRRLDPFMKNGLVRVGGRLDRAEIHENLKHPILLPKKSHITTLIIRSCHEHLGHVGRNHVISSLREKYWIVNMNSAVRHVLSCCVTCKRLWAPPIEQKMADLPFERVNAAPPFTYIGVDYFGPYAIKEGRKEYKRYGVLFTCLASRAIHIETANSLTTDSFIDAFRRFQARRGAVRTLYSDNGTNFTGAERELHECLAEMDNDKINRYLLNAAVDWKFNPPTASHQGGVWERQIRSVRKVLAPMLLEHGQRLDDESFRTLMCEVESIVNSRPLTTISSDATDLTPLSPSQILTMKSRQIYPPAGVFEKNDVYMRRKWRRVQYIANLFWTRWSKEYLTSLQTRQKWTVPRRNLQLNDVVLLKDDTLDRSQWLLAKVVSLETDKKGLTRSVQVKTTTQTLRRPVQKLVLLVPACNDQA